MDAQETLHTVNLVTCGHFASFYVVFCFSLVIFLSHLDCLISVCLFFVIVHLFMFILGSFSFYGYFCFSLFIFVSLII